MALRRPLVAAAVLIALIKCVQFAIDSQILFFDDSGAFLLNALGYAFIPERSYVYSGLIREFSVSTHSLRAIVAMQVMMGGITAWLLVFILLRYLAVRPWIAIAGGLVFAWDPVQLVHERLIMAEATAMLAVALFLAAALEYIRTFRWVWLVAASIAGILLVSTRTVYVPASLVCAVLLPVGAWFAAPARRPAALIAALVGSCGLTVLLHAGYQHLTGKLAGREPAYQYRTGDFLVSLVAPLVSADDAKDPRERQAIEAQNRSDLPLSDIDGRARQMWDSAGFVAQLRNAFSGDASAAEKAGNRLGRAAILRRPLGFVWLGVHTYFEYWEAIPRMKQFLANEHGAPGRPVVPEAGVRMIAAEFGSDVSTQHTLATPSRRYHLLLSDWNIVLLLSPLLAAAALWLRPGLTQGAAPLFAWTLVLTTATFLGASEVVYRYLHPFSFSAVAALAAIADVHRTRRQDEALPERAEEEPVGV